MPTNPYHPDLDLVPARETLNESIEALIMRSWERGALANPNNLAVLVREIIRRVRLVPGGN